MPEVSSEFIVDQVLPRFAFGTDVHLTPRPGGLINRTFLVRGSRPDARGVFVLQQVNPIFPRGIHDNIAAVTGALERAGVVTPHLLATGQGLPYLDAPACAASGGVSTVWRLMNYIEGVSFDVVADAEQAFAAGVVVARFHAALRGLRHRFVGRRAGVHDTARHLDELARAVGGHAAHRLFAAVKPLADQILSAAGALPALPELPARICHGDLKFNNIVFAGDDPVRSRQAICLVDLDTVGPMALAHELGDAWRSWCNRNGEDHPRAELDADIFSASWEGYRSALGRDLLEGERDALVLGPEWITLELAARFAADALSESYFGWDASRFAGRGEHNLVRARGQLSLFRAFGDRRADRARTLGVATPAAGGGGVRVNSIDECH